MKRSSNDSKSREWRKSQRMKDSAQGGGAGGVLKLKPLKAIKVKTGILRG